MGALEGLTWIFVAAGVLLLSAASLGGGIEIKEVKIPRLNWVARILSGILGLAFVGFAVGIPGSSDDPVIRSFDANPEKIAIGESSILRWSISAATEVTIEPGIGVVPLSGERMVSPSETTHYRLRAVNDAGGSDDRTTVVWVDPRQKPVISTFEASPARINAGANSILNWTVSGAELVTIEPEIGEVPSSGVRLISPTESTTYTLRARNDAGDSEASTSISVVGEPVISSFVAHPERVAAGESSVLSWSVSAAELVTIEPEIGEVPSSGEHMVSPVETATYILRARNDAGDAEASIDVWVIGKPVIGSFVANPERITAGASSILSWSVSDAELVTIAPEIGEVPPSGEHMVSPSETMAYTLRARNDAGDTEASIDVWVIGKPVIGSFVANPERITAGESSILSWSVSDAELVTIAPEIGEVPLSGERTVSPSETTEYTLRAANDAASVHDNVRVIVRESLSEDCITFDLSALELRQDGEQWLLTDGRSRMLLFNNRNEGRRALGIIKHYGMNSRCFVGRPDPSMVYYLANGHAPRGPVEEEDCISFDPEVLQIRKSGDLWLLMEGSHSLMAFPNEEEVGQAIEIIRKYRFTKTCYVGRPDPSMTYLRD